MSKSIYLVTTLASSSILVMSGSCGKEDPSPNVKDSESPSTGLGFFIGRAEGQGKGGIFPEEAASDRDCEGLSEATEDSEPRSDAEAEGADSESLSLKQTFLEDFFLGLAFARGFGEGLPFLTPSETFVS